MELERESRCWGAAPALGLVAAALVTFGDGLTCDVVRTDSLESGMPLHETPGSTGLAGSMQPPQPLTVR